ncbi:MAG: hypothetical protein HGB21_09185 [Nitrospirae bacterium]|nr:hypothetical protein [Nitrospirota bacterium]
MNRKYLVAVLITLMVLFFGPTSVFAEYVINLQGAAVFTEKNDIRIPGDSGTKFSLADDLSADTAYTGRLEAGYIHNAKDYFGIVIAPLSVDSHGRVDRNIDYAGTTFPAGMDLKATFRFDSYRLTWRRKLVSRDDLDVWLGVSGNIRDAEITVEGGGQRATKANTGFVPLINFLFDWRFSKPWSFRVAGDALVGPQGRAEDVLLALIYAVAPSTKLFAGYRVLEGGADNDEVYTFSLFHYAVAGMEVRY